VNFHDLNDFTDPVVIDEITRIIKDNLFLVDFNALEDMGTMSMDKIHPSIYQAVSKLPPKSMP